VTEEHFDELESMVDVTRLHIDHPGRHIEVTRRMSGDAHWHIDDAGAASEVTAPVADVTSSHIDDPARLENGYPPLVAPHERLAGGHHE
jgi:hypothetical protein